MYLLFFKKELLQLDGLVCVCFFLGSRPNSPTMSLVLVLHTYTSRVPRIQLAPARGSVPCRSRHQHQSHSETHRRSACSHSRTRRPSRHHARTCCLPRSTLYYAIGVMRAVLVDVRYGSGE